MLDFELAKYVYIEYSIAVLLFSELFKLLLKGINVQAIQFIAVKEPKWLTLIVAIVISIFDWIFIGKGGTFHFYQMAISFGIAVLGYDYAFKLIKDLFVKVRDLFRAKDGTP